ncbi:MAG: tyrosine-protein phosphatase [Terriglobales bacterium]
MPESQAVIDVHCHILPDVDDGPKSWEAAEEMCRMASEDGIQHIVATPHANDRYHYDRQYLSDLLDSLRQRVGKFPRFSLGCDFHLSYENFQDLMVTPSRYCIEGTPYVLVELSNYSIPAQIDDCLAKMHEKGITSVITHPERNPILQQDPERVMRWVEMRCAVQVTASAITGFWGERAWRAAQWLLKHEAVHVLATDAHDTKNRVPQLSHAREAVEETCGADVARALVEDNPHAIINGMPLPYFPIPPRK